MQQDLEDYLDMAAHRLRLRRKLPHLQLSVWGFTLGPWGKSRGYKTMRNKVGGAPTPAGTPRCSLRAAGVPAQHARVFVGGGGTRGPSAVAADMLTHVVVRA